jgi:beta-phosphoglucomutase-like phosphatase (HAD superfamily)
VTLPRPVKAVVFDMDGLLFDTETLYHRAMVEVARGMGLVMPLAFYLSMVGLPGVECKQRLAEHYGEGFDLEGFWTRSRSRFHGLCAAELRLKGGVLELLDLLDRLKLPRAIATSSGWPSVQDHLAAHDLHRRFDAVVAHGDYARGKPHPDPYLKAAERLGVAPGDCLALEDSHNGVRAAAAAGMMTVMAPDMLAATPEMHELCVAVVGDLHEVRTLLAP